MLHRKFLVLAFFMPSVVLFQGVSSAVTYGKGSSKRLGDRLLHYVKAKWISYKYGIPLLHKPFTYSSRLALHYHEKEYSEEIKKRFKTTVEIENDSDVSIKKNSKVLYEVNYHFKEKAWDNAYEINAFHGLIDDPKFIAELKRMIRPCEPISRQLLPSDRITVAVHVRKGSWYDFPLASQQLYSRAIADYGADHNKQYSDKRWPFKFPPDQYYIDQIINLSEMLGNVPLYVHVFTDDLQPKKIVDRYKKAAGKQNITYACREKENYYYAHVLDDLFTMATFDCLIRARSNYSLIAELVGDHKIVIYPKEITWLDNKLIVDEVGIVKKGTLAKRKLERLS